MPNKLPKPKKAKGKRAKIKPKRAGETANERLARDMAIARQSTDRSNP